MKQCITFLGLVFVVKFVELFDIIGCYFTSHNSISFSFLYILYHNLRRNSNFYLLCKPRPVASQWNGPHHFLVRFIPSRTDRPQSSTYFSNQITTQSYIFIFPFVTIGSFTNPSGTATYCSSICFTNCFCGLLATIVFGDKFIINR